MASRLQWPVPEANFEMSDARERLDPRQLTDQALQEQVESGYGRLREALPYLGSLAAKVARVHGDHQPHLAEVRDAVAELADLLLSHIEEEPRLLPVRTESRSAADRLGAEHLALSEELERLRRAARGFVLPVSACNSYRALFGGLETLECELRAQLDLEQHALERIAGG